MRCARIREPACLLGILDTARRAFSASYPSFSGGTCQFDIINDGWQTQPDTNLNWTFNIIPRTWGNNLTVFVDVQPIIQFLGDGTEARATWSRRARSNASVPTVLGALGSDETLDLLEHAYTNTLVGLHVIEGVGALRPFDRERFARLIS